MVEMIEITEVNKCGDGKDYIVVLTVQDLIFHQVKNYINAKNKDKIDSIACHVYIENNDISNINFSFYTKADSWREFFIKNVDFNNIKKITEFINHFMQSAPQPV